ncbi:hypothetical protein [Olleya sp. R77988]|uniref:hypothetical protein n=1 Tax=Olleya sp. R77988 TaxID=3093875 RepID=UPI0037CB70CA
MSDNLTEKKDTKIIHYFGIGAFFILTLFELCGFFGEILKDTLIVFNQNPKTTYILSVLTSLVTFTLMLMLLLKKIKSTSKNNSRKLLVISIISLIISWALIVCYDEFIADLLASKHSNNYSIYNDFWKDKYLLKGYLLMVPVLYYFILAFVVLKKEKL